MLLWTSQLIYTWFLIQSYCVCCSDCHTESNKSRITVVGSVLVDCNQHCCLDQVKRYQIVGVQLGEKHLSGDIEGILVQRIDRNRRLSAQ